MYLLIKNVMIKDRKRGRDPYSGIILFLRRWKMKLLIKQRVFSWSDTYDIYDENENPKYFVKGEILSLGQQAPCL